MDVSGVSPEAQVTLTKRRAFGSSRVAYGLLKRRFMLSSAMMILTLLSSTPASETTRTLSPPPAPFAAPGLGVSSASGQRYGLAFTQGIDRTADAGVLLTTRAAFLRPLSKRWDAGAELVFALSPIHGVNEEIVALYSGGLGGFARLRLVSSEIAIFGLRHATSVSVGGSRRQSWANWYFVPREDWSDGAFITDTALDLVCDLRANGVTFSIAAVGALRWKIVRDARHYTVAAPGLSGPVLTYNEVYASTGGRFGMTIAISHALAAVLSGQVAAVAQLDRLGDPWMQLGVVAGGSLGFAFSAM